jgi:hypothetical protein
MPFHFGIIPRLEEKEWAGHPALPLSFRSLT